ncbi:hypothetical protein [Fusibacter ferrireducens]|nr:hypothetical protein [Fusibacter ferrireducens]
MIKKVLAISLLMLMTTSVAFANGEDIPRLYSAPMIAHVVAF